MAGPSRGSTSDTVSSDRGAWVSRRQFLRSAAALGAAGAAGALLNACGSSSSTTAPPTTAAPTAAAASGATSAAAAKAPAVRPAQRGRWRRRLRRAPQRRVRRRVMHPPLRRPAGHDPLISNPTRTRCPSRWLSSILLDKTCSGSSCGPMRIPHPVPTSPPRVGRFRRMARATPWRCARREFGNGDPFTAADVKFTFDLMQDKKSNAAFLNDLGRFTGARYDRSDDHRLDLSAQYAPLLTQLGYNIMIVPKKVFQGQDSTSRPVSSRPSAPAPTNGRNSFSGDHVTLVATRTTRTRRRKSARSSRKSSDLNTRVAQSRAGRRCRHAEQSQVDALQNVSNVVIDAANQDWLDLSVSDSNPLFTDERVRRALSYALDRPTMMKSILAARARSPMGESRRRCRGRVRRIGGHPLRHEEGAGPTVRAGWQNQAAS